MAVYATVEDMVERFGESELIQLSDRLEPYARVVVRPVVDAALADASAEIEGYVQSRYPLPLSSTPRVLTRICCDLARKHLHRDRPTDAVAKDAESARQQLRAIARGELALEGTAGAPAPAADVRRSGPDRVFSSDTLAGL
jgi:phage gp36-like protein